MGMFPGRDDERWRMERPIKAFNYGPEAVDYIRCRISESGDALSLALLDLDLLNHGEVVAQLPADVDPVSLYKFRSDIFWGSPKGAGTHMVDEFLAFATDFLRRGEYRILLSEAWTGTDRNLEPSDIKNFTYSSRKRSDRFGLCRYLHLPSGEPAHVRRFLSCINSGPLVMADLSGNPETLVAILHGDDVSQETFSLIASAAVHISVDVYDGRANLIWSLKTDEELRAKWQAGNRDTM
jgi:hypothetical protein